MSENSSKSRTTQRQEALTQLTQLQLDTYSQQYVLLAPRYDGNYQDPRMGPNVRTTERKT